MSFDKLYAKALGAAGGRKKRGKHGKGRYHIVERHRDSGWSHLTSTDDRNIAERVIAAKMDDRPTVMFDDDGEILFAGNMSGVDEPARAFIERIISSVGSPGGKPKTEWTGRRVPINVVIYGDGAVYGASDHPNSGSAYGSYWVGLRLEHEKFEIWRYSVPSKLADALKVQGTSDQEFSDGYTAMSALAPFKGKKVSFYDPEED